MASAPRSWIRKLLILPPIVVGVGVLAWQLSGAGGPEQGEVQEVVRVVRVIAAAPVEFVPRAIGHGTVAPDQIWEAVAQVAGKIVRKHPDLERGRLIEAGTEILGIDPADYQLGLARSEANLESARAQLTELDATLANTEASRAIEQRALVLAERDLEREQSLLERGNISQAALDATETELLNRRQRVQELENQLTLIPAQRRVLEASITLNQATRDQAALDLERTTIRMPFDGRIATVDVESSEFVNVGQVLVAADAIAVAEIEAQFPIGHVMPLLPTDIDLSALSAAELAAVPRQFGLEATVRFRTGTVAASWVARFDRVADRMDPQTRTVGLIVAVDDPYRQAIPGKRPPLVKDMFVEVELRGRARPEALVVPRVAVHRGADDRPALYLARDDDRLEIRTVALGPVQDDLAVVTDGLAEGERVVVSDLIPAIAGMKLDARLDASLGERLRAQATGAPPAALVQ